MIDLQARLAGLDISSLDVIDLGCGSCSSPISSQVLRLPWHSLTSVDVHRPVLDHVIAQPKAARAFEPVQADIRDYLLEDHPCDVVLLIDVLEHFPKTDGLWILDRLTSFVRQRVVIWLPLGECPQGELDGNLFQAHLASWSADELLAADYAVHVLPRFHTQFSPPVDAAWATWNSGKE